MAEIELVDVAREDVVPSPLEERARGALGVDVLVKALGRDEAVAQRGDALLLVGAAGDPRPVTGLQGAIQWPPYVLPGGKGMLVLTTENHGFAYRLWRVPFVAPVAELLFKGGAEAGQDDDLDPVTWSRAVPVAGGYVLLGDDKLVLVANDGTLRAEARHDDLSELEPVLGGRCVVLSEDEGPAVLFAVAGDALVKLAELPSDPRDIVVEGTRVFWNDLGNDEIRWKEVTGLHDALVAAGA